MSMYIGRVSRDATSRRHIFTRDDQTTTWSDAITPPRCGDVAFSKHSVYPRLMLSPSLVVSDVQEVICMTSIRPGFDSTSTSPTPIPTPAVRFDSDSNSGCLGSIPTPIPTLVQLLMIMWKH